MNTKKIFLMSALTLLVCGCQEDEGTLIQPTPGEEVKFGGRLDASPMTRTIYGESDGNGFPIYWVNGDQVLVASPECANNNGIGSATYAISVENEEQNYATSMDKTGDAGVQWGDNATANFYSIYPASDYTRFTQSLTSARLTVTTQQNNTWDPDPKTNTVSPDMSACFMYAKTENVQNGSEVNLAYKPLSTAVRFTVNGPTSGEPVTISFIRLHAPTGVALSGTFNVDFTQTGTDGMPAVTAVTGRTFNYASMNAASSSGAYLTLGAGESVDVQLFFLLEQEIKMDKNWYIEVATTSGTYKKNLTASGNMTLKPGQIHELPDLPTLNPGGEWDPANWMVNIQRNVYLSEISIPGSWNSLNPDFQGENPSITDQYNAGVRAFHLDTRWRATGGWWGLIGNSPITDLGIANGGSTYDVVGDNGKRLKCMTQAAPTFASALTEITSKVQEDEYMVVYCTFAQGSTVYGDWRAEIAKACANNESVIDARTLDANSTVADVLGNVIVIVSTYTPGELQSKTFFTNMRNELDEEYAKTDYLVRPLTYNNSTSSGISLYATYAQKTNDGDGATGETGDRGYEPTLTERQTKCKNLLNWSQNNYSTGNFQHNAWIYMGLGGYVLEEGLYRDTENYAAVNNSLITWLKDKLNEMETNEAYYPVGIVFMNGVVNRQQGTTVDIRQTVKDILLLNNRYRKAYDPDRSPVDGAYISDGASAVSSAAPGYSSGMTDNHTNAIVW